MIREIVIEIKPYKDNLSGDGGEFHASIDGVHHGVAKVETEAALNALMAKYKHEISQQPRDGGPRQQSFW